MKEIKLKISGMHCQSCEKLIKMDLEDLDGVLDIKIDSKDGMGKIAVADNVSSGLIIKTIGDTGYKAELMGEDNEK